MSIETFRLGIRAAIRGLWAGVLDSYQFDVAMRSAIGRHIPEAWALGAAEGGITPDEYTPEENAALAQFLSNQYAYIGELAVYIVEHYSKAKGKPLQPLLNRVELWVNRYEEARNQAKALAMADQKLEWRFGPTKEHCSSCRKMNGKVKRGSYWTAHGALPRTQALECGGFLCLCSLEPTKRPITPGPLPRLP